MPTVVELRDLLKARGLDFKGNKGVLEARLAEADAADSSDATQPRSHNKRKTPASAAAAGAAQKRQSVPASPPGSPRAAAAADGFEDLFEQFKQQFTDRASAQTADIKRALAEAQAAAASAEAKLISAKAESEAKLSNLQQQLKEAAQTNAKTALQPLPHFTQYSRTGTEAVPPGGAIFTHLEENFLRTATRHRGPRQGDPHRSAPEFQVQTSHFALRCVWRYRHHFSGA
jgi:hypothetical protein